MGCRRRAVGCGPVLVRRVRSLPSPLPDLPVDRRGVGVAPRTDRGDAFRRGRHRGRRRHVRELHGPVPGVPRVRRRVPVARAVRPDDGARAGPGRTAPQPPRPVAAMARPRRRASASGAPSGRDVPATDRATVPAATDARAGAHAHVAVRAPAARDRAARGRRMSGGRWRSSPDACRIAGSTR